MPASANAMEEQVMALEDASPREGKVNVKLELSMLRWGITREIEVFAKGWRRRWGADAMLVYLVEEIQGQRSGARWCGAFLVVDLRCMQPWARQE